MNYTNIDLNSTTPPKCQCGAYLDYEEQSNRLICTGKTCIKTRLASVLTTLQALDRLTIADGTEYNLVTLAKKNYDLLEQFIQTCDIQSGVELITKGVDLTTLGELGIRLGHIIDTFEFKLSDLSVLCGSKLLLHSQIDFSVLPIGDKRLAIAEINRQLGIDGSILLATLLYEDFEKYFNEVLKLTDYVTLYRPSTKKRSATPITLNLPEDFSYTNELGMENISISTTAEGDTADNTTSALSEEGSTSDDNAVTTSTMEDFLEW